MQRAFEAYQELGFVILFVFMGVFTYQTDSKGLCVTTQIIILFSINFVSSIFFIKAFLGTWFVF
jgi:hypothetical protein